MCIADSFIEAESVVFFVKKSCAYAVGNLVRGSGIGEAIVDFVVLAQMASISALITEYRAAKRAHPFFLGVEGDVFHDVLNTELVLTVVKDCPQRPLQSLVVIRDNYSRSSNLVALDEAIQKLKDPAERGFLLAAH
jgi:hypothetical protein